MERKKELKRVVDWLMRKQENKMGKMYNRIREKSAQKEPEKFICRKCLTEFLKKYLFKLHWETCKETV